MANLIWVLVEFIILLFILQLVFFEMSYRRIRKTDDLSWYISLEQPYRYNRTGYMAFLCLICYILTTDQSFFSAGWFLYFFVFLALGIIADATVQYILLHYSRFRCRKHIREANELRTEVLKYKDYDGECFDYFISTKNFDEVTLLRDYVTPSDHLAILSVDQGDFAKNYYPLPAKVYDVEPYGDIEKVKNNLNNTPIRPLTLTKSQQMPFKDNKIDIIMNQFCNYNKDELKRVLKPNGYVVIHQNGTDNYKEFVDMYMPFKMKGEWNSQACCQSLQQIGFSIIQSIDDFGYIQFRSIEGMISFFKKYSPDISDIEKYVNFYMTALKKIKSGEPYRITTYNFLVIAKNGPIY